MPPPKNVKLGPKTRKILEGSVLYDKDEFPAHQAWADETESILSFLEEQKQYDRFLPRLRAKERAAAIAEARTGYYFNQNGFRILQWEPEVVPGNPGDLEIAHQDSDSVFLEVKYPGWGGELTDEEIQSGRAKLPKYINAEARSINPVERVLYSVGKALPKFESGRANVVVAVDDLFVSPLESPSVFVSGRLARELLNPLYASVSGVFLLNSVLFDSEVKYRAGFVPGSGRELPPDVITKFLDLSSC